MIQNSPSWSHAHWKPVGCNLRLFDKTGLSPGVCFVPLGRVGCVCDIGWRRWSTRREPLPVRYLLQKPFNAEVALNTTMAKCGEVLRSRPYPPFSTTHIHTHTLSTSWLGNFRGAITILLWIVSVTMLGWWFESEKLNGFNDLWVTEKKNVFFCIQ